MYSVKCAVNSVHYFRKKKDNQIGFIIGPGNLIGGGCDENRRKHK